MSRGLAVVIGILLASSGAALAADRPPVESWGKPGVGFAQYRTDAVECAKIGYFRDVSQDEPAKRFIRGFETADNGLNGAGSPNIDAWIDSVQRVRPDRQKRLVHAIQVGDVEQCLSDKGYRPFTLTKAEAKTLARYPRGSEERHRFLHALAAR
ncbi:hypothetical protein [Sphingomonas sp. Leaf21]|uniref:hypothetical protein n=1 Tax=Sphingomonas sp. Leaf21 TaxID=2876550 RepID=UPI001E62E6E4|nr:hypothetical protein [Sphingomonas sp. Leaf21]